MYLDFCREGDSRREGESGVLPVQDLFQHPPLGDKCLHGPQHSYCAVMSSKGTLEEPQLVNSVVCSYLSPGVDVGAGQDELQLVNSVMWSYLSLGVGVGVGTSLIWVVCPTSGESRLRETIHL